jgi:hypothetical protein
MSSFNKEIIKPVTIQEIVSAYNNAVETLDEVYGMLEAAQERLGAAFPEYDQHSRFDVFQYLKDWKKTNDNSHNPRYHSARTKFKRSVWNTIFTVTGMRKLMSKKRLEETEKNLEKGKLDPVTIPNIIDFLTLLQSNLPTLAEEVVKESFEILRPRNNEHKTNTQYEIGKKAILTWKVEHGYGTGLRRVRYYAENSLTSLDKAMSLLDGKGIIEGYRSPLVDAINTSTTGNGETEYFKFKTFKNGNLHLEFKRMDLIAEINRIGGGGAIKPDNLNPNQDKYTKNDGPDYETVKARKTYAEQQEREPQKKDQPPAPNGTAAARIMSLVGQQ